MLRLWPGESNPGRRGCEVARSAQLTVSRTMTSAIWRWKAMGRMCRCLLGHIQKLAIPWAYDTAWLGTRVSESKRLLSYPRQRSKLPSSRRKLWGQVIIMGAATNHSGASCPVSARLCWPMGSAGGDHTADSPTAPSAAHHPVLTVRSEQWAILVSSCLWKLHFTCIFIAQWGVGSFCVFFF